MSKETCPSLEGDLPPRPRETTPSPEVDLRRRPSRVLRDCWPAWSAWCCAPSPGLETVRA